MKPYFESEERQAQLIYHAGLWLGTPFRPHASVMGAGVDCVRLVASVLTATGFLREAEFPVYSMDGGKHQDNSQLTAWLETHGGFQKVDDVHVRTGDVLCFRLLGRSAHHAGLTLCPPQFVHCLFRRKVVAATLADPTWKKALEAVYRPME